MVKVSALVEAVAVGLMVMFAIAEVGLVIWN